MKVIDFGDWHTHPDWDAIARAAGGVIIKISEGQTLSNLYEPHIANAIAYGLTWGVYCLTHAETTEEAVREAQVVLEALETLGYPQLGIWYDVEQDYADAHMPEDNTACASAFISACNARGYSAGVYGSYDTLTNRLHVDQLADYVPYWAAQYGRRANDFALEHPDKRVIGWQYTDSYQISGENYDMNEWADE